MTDERTSMTLEFHPIADEFPLLKNKDFDELIEDIRAKGLQEPVVLFEGKILDGRNRYLACIRTGVLARFREYEGDDPIGFVTSVNLRRRHLTAGQRAAIAVNLANLTRGGVSAAGRFSENLRGGGWRGFCRPGNIRWRGLARRRLFSGW